jgi:anti-sigma regulatory factor (Ser/Thr protein kinase)
VDERNFYDLGEQRRWQPPYQNRRVRVRAVLTRTEAEYVIEDEGPGFDPGTVADPTDPANIERIGGRGLMLMRAFMDEVEHSNGGKRITLRRRYRNAHCEAAQSEEA